VLGIEKNAEHKASKALGKVDQLKTKHAIPREIQNAIDAIANWFNGK